MQDEEWGPWHDHDGTHRPVRPGAFVHTILGNDPVTGHSPGDGEWLNPKGALNDYEWMGIDDGNPAGWVWDYLDDGRGFFPIVRYRIKKPKGLQLLEHLLKKVDALSPEELELAEIVYADN